MKIASFLLDPETSKGFNDIIEVVREKVDPNASPDDVISFIIYRVWTEIFACEEETEIE